MPGHLFITRADIRHLACDAWLLPTDTALTIEDIWTRDDARLRGAAEPAIEGEWRVHRWLDGGERRPEVWLGNVGHRDVRDVVREFVRCASGRPRPNAVRRDRRLLAIPFLGTREGGQAEVKGRVAMDLVQTLAEELTDADADVVLVAFHDDALAAAQHARRMHAGDGWRDLWLRAFDGDEGAVSTGQRLAAHARRGRLVVFVGAGVSAGAGLPQWSELLDGLAEKVPGVSEGLQELALLDRATVIAAALARAGTKVGDAVVDVLPKGPPYALAHSYIAALPVTETITTNYDDLLEQAARDVNRPYTVLESQSLADAERWLLKLHGSIAAPDEIVLTRDDYLGYGTNRAALRGIVQAMLITRHMLFVGFGLSDDNFHAIAHEVRTALRPGTARADAAPFGTALLVHEQPLFDQLWKGDIGPAPLASAEAPVGVGARRVEVMLDLVLAESTGALAHFMDPAFRDLLTPEEQELQDDLQRLAAKRKTGSPAWDAVSELLEQLGLPRQD